MTDKSDMKVAAKSPNEKQRIQSLKSLNILDTSPEAEYDELTQLASYICDTPIALISLVDESRQWFKAKVGLESSQMNREVAFCAHAILGKDLFEIENAHLDERFSDNPLVTDEPHIVFYAGMPLVSEDGLALGTLCVIDHQPRKLNLEQKKALRTLARQVCRLFEIISKLSSMHDLNKTLESRNTAIENITEGVVIQDRSGKIVEFNPAALEVLGLTAEQITDKNSMDPDWQAIREDGSSFPGSEHPSMIALATGVRQKNVVMGVHQPNKSLKWIQINATPIFFEGKDKASHVVVGFDDITEQRLQRQVIEKKEADLKRILDNMPSMIGYWDKNLINLHANHAYLRCFGKTPEQIKGMHMKDLVGPISFNKNLIYVQNVLNGSTQNFEREIVFYDGTVHHTYVTYLPDYFGEEILGFFVIITDLTEIKNLEKQRTEMQAKLTESSRLSALGEMAGGIAHEINNPLTIIKGKALQARSKIELGIYKNEDLIKSLVTIESTVDRISKIIKGLRSFSRNAESDPFEIVKLSNIVEDTLSLCAERFKAGDVAINVNPFVDTQVECRLAQLSQVLVNLMGNAYDAICEKNERWVDLNIDHSNNNIKISVTDSGTGIPPEIVQKIMEPFFTTKEVGKGTGLGLSISKGIIESHRGSFYYDSECCNTRFVIEIPVSQSLKLAS